MNLWTEEFLPRDVKQLAVHNRKVEEVQQWLRQHAALGASSSGSDPGTPSEPLSPALTASRDVQAGGGGLQIVRFGVHSQATSRVLLLRGPPGCGKTTVVRVLASTLGLQVHEWCAPVPTPWSEHQQLRTSLGGAGVPAYTSKLDAFLAFLASCTKYRPLDLQPGGGAPARPASAARPQHEHLPPPALARRPDAEGGAPPGAASRSRRGQAWPRAPGKGAAGAGGPGNGQWGSLDVGLLLPEGLVREGVAAEVRGDGDGETSHGASGGVGEAQGRGLLEELRGMRGRSSSREADAGPAGREGRGGRRQGRLGHAALPAGNRGPSPMGTCCQGGEEPGMQAARGHKGLRFRGSAQRGVQKSWDRGLSSEVVSSSRSERAGEEDTVTVVPAASGHGGQNGQWCSSREHAGHGAAAGRWALAQPRVEEGAEPAGQDPRAPEASSASLASSSALPPLLLVDDLPYVASRAALVQLCSALHAAARGAAVPVVVVLSDATASTAPPASGSGRGGGPESSGEAWGETVKRAVQAALEHGGASTVVFNPVTPRMICKALASILDRLALRGEAAAAAPPRALLDEVAEQSAGDLRRAICQLQLIFGSGSRCCSTTSGAPEPQSGSGLELHNWPWDPGGDPVVCGSTRRHGRGRGGKTRGSGGGKRKGEQVLGGDRVPASQTGGEGEAAHDGVGKCGPRRLDRTVRDHSLTLFHAVGKFLHNKRRGLADPASSLSVGDAVRLVTGAAVAEAGGECQVSACHWRPPLDMEPPEEIMGRAQLDAASLCNFLHENYPDFLDVGAGTEDAARASAYLSDAALLVEGGLFGAHRSSRAPLLEDEAGALGQGLAAAAASSVAARGLLYSNQHPAPTRFRAIRAPACLEADRRRRATQAQLMEETRTVAAAAGQPPVTLSQLVTEPLRRPHCLGIPHVWQKQTWQGQPHQAASSDHRSATGAAGQGVGPRPLDGSNQESSDEIEND